MITKFKQQRIMKPIYNVWILLFCLTFSSCYNEDIIEPTPDPLALAGGFEFPQGDNPWDNDALEIYKNFGVKLIYKNIAEKDLNKSWTNGGLSNSSKIFENCLNDEMGAFYITFMKSHVFPYLNREVTDRVFPMYWYFVYNYSVFTSISVLEFHVALKEHDENQTDCWVTCFWGDAFHCSDFMSGMIMNPRDPFTEWLSPIAGNQDSYTIRRFKIIDEIIRTAITRGNIIIPEEEFDAGFDHSTPLIRNEDIESKADPNYYLRRGYPGDVNSLSAKYSKPHSDNPPTAKETFIGYMQIAMRLTKEEREAMWPSATYPFMSSKFEFVTNYLKKYNIDLEAIAQGPEEWDIKPYPELPEADAGDDDDDPWGDW